MGRDKGRLRVGGQTMVGLVRKAAAGAGFPVRIIRRDCVPRCGPLGRIYTGLKSTRAEVVLFLACDMPFVSAELIRFLVARWGPSEEGLFVWSKDGVGFPLLLWRTTLHTVGEQIERNQLS